MIRSGMFSIAMLTGLLLLAAGERRAGDQTPPEDVVVRVPGDLDPSEPAPLLILLHGFTLTGAAQEAWWRLWPVAEANGFLFASPTGSTDANGLTYWNANDNCCDYEDTDVDHVAYLIDLVDAIRVTHNVDPNRIHLVGYSNGGCMAYRMACDRGDVFASVVSVAGATWMDPANCPADHPVHVLHVHGTEDTVVSYKGGFDPFNPPYPHPGAVGSVAQWVENNGCDPDSWVTSPPFDFTSEVFGIETDVIRYEEPCEPNGSVELWRIQGGSHFPSLTDEGRARLVEFLVDHPKVAPCPADLDASGRVDAGDLGILIIAWNSSASSVDLNGDGRIDSGDLGILIAAWGPCP